HRQQYPTANPDIDYPDVYDYFRNPDGTPKYPQRGVDIGAAGTHGSTGQIPTGRFNGKMIVVECLLDGDALPWQADWYRKKVAAVDGPQIDDKYRLWYVDNANHTDPTTETQQTHAVAYSGTVQYALRELSAWVEQGTAPPPTSEYWVQDGQVHVPASAGERQGIQPVVHLKAHGGETPAGHTNACSLTPLRQRPVHRGRECGAACDRIRFHSLSMTSLPARGTISTRASAMWSFHQRT